MQVSAPGIIWPVLSLLAVALLSSLISGCTKKEPPPTSDPHYYTGPMKAKPVDGSRRPKPTEGQ